MPITYKISISSLKKILHYENTYRYVGFKNQHNFNTNQMQFNPENARTRKQDVATGLNAWTHPVVEIIVYEVFEFRLYGFNGSSCDATSKIPPQRKLSQQGCQATSRIIKRIKLA